jgi:hypothetical protein
MPWLSLLAGLAGQLKEGYETSVESAAMNH